MPIAFCAMTWNLENLYPANSADGPKSPDLYERKMRNLAQTILSIAPDVLAVQEVGDPNSFADLQRRLNDKYPYTMLSTKPDPRGIRVGFISRYPLVQAREFDSFPPEALLGVPSSGGGKEVNNMGRGVLKATVVLAPGVLINVVTCHLKSKLVTYPGNRRSPKDEDERAKETGYTLIKRTAECVALRVYLNRLLTGNNEPLILMGDFNDGVEAVTTQILLGPPDRSLSARDKFDDIRLYNLAEYISPERRYSRLYLKEKELIDHICVSNELIFHRRQVDAFVEPIENIDASTEARREAVYPDHAPLFARFEIPLPSENTLLKG
ncbi:MAG: endonuclease/exonuclease/phosphatase family protein [Anaerolineae bacterium]|nr:endonuclease/exonuclease/phosphatase family protein [Anaerolineae bacterium]